MTARWADMAALLPHAGAMVLLDRVDDWSPRQILCTATSHRAPANPLRHADELPAMAGIEYAAQAIAAHGALAEQHAVGRAPMGLLAAVRDVRLHVRRLDGDYPVLRVSAAKMLGDRQRAIYEFAIEGGDIRLLDGRATVVVIGAPPA
jgi:predicted hotdog family 3-hydroxylacyl-ACP dehydratase